MNWIDEYVHRMFTQEEPVEWAQFCEEFGLPETTEPDPLQLYDAVMRTMKQAVLLALPRLLTVLIDKGCRGDVPAIRLLFGMSKPEVNKEKTTSDSMEIFREL